MDGAKHCFRCWLLREQNQLLGFIALTFWEVGPGCKQINVRGQSKKVGKEHRLMFGLQRSPLCEVDRGTQELKVLP